MAMVALSQEARSHLERYLQQIRTALREHPSVDADEVERDVLGHITAELSGEREPIGATRLLNILEQLGAPDKWLPTDHHAGWREPVEAVPSGAGSWRLAIVTFAAFVAGPALFMGRVILWPLPPLLFVLSFVLARLTLARLAERDEPIGSRRWLIYPPLVVWYGALFVVLLGGPPLLAAVFLSDDPMFRSRVLFAFGEPNGMRVMSIVLGIWWMLLAFLLHKFAKGVRTVFWPFAEWFERKHAIRLAVLGLGIAVGQATILAFLMSR